MKRKLSTNQEQSVKQDTQSARRRLLKTIAAGSGAVIAGKNLPDNWTKPAIDSVLLPAHAQTSPAVPPPGVVPSTLSIGTPITIASAGTTQDILCIAGPEFNVFTVNVTSTVSKDAETLTMTRTWTTIANNSGKNVTDVTNIPIVGNVATITTPPSAAIQACSTSFNDIGSSITLAFTISDGSAPALDAGTWTAE